METAIRIGIFLTFFALLALWEYWRPRRVLSQIKRTRWLTNLSLVVVDALVLRLMGGIVAFAAAVYVQQQGWGWLNNVAWPYWLEFIIALVLLDFALYLQHVATHHVPLLWRLHRVHHTDLDIDLTTGVRFHPIEIGLSMLYKIVLVIALGAAPWAVLVFELILNGASLFNHSNIYIPEKIDRRVRKFVITPDMHRVHHSTIVKETNSNFGFSIALWDRACGTYCKTPALGHLGMEIGLKEYRDPQGLGFIQLLLLPFHGTPGNYNAQKDEKPVVPSEQ
jgi:sterol desaturase/sphingolipid hydroxylase (fatty acid hydroxylase superfamily)